MRATNCSTCLAGHDRVWAGKGVNPSVFSAGVNYTIKVPGL